VCLLVSLAIATIIILTVPFTLIYVFKQPLDETGVLRECLRLTKSYFICNYVN
jgi:hypothetical protein